MIVEVLYHDGWGIKRDAEGNEIKDEHGSYEWEPTFSLLTFDTKYIVWMRRHKVGSQDWVEVCLFDHRTQFKFPMTYEEAKKKFRK